MRTYYEFLAGGGMASLGYGPGWMCTFANDIDRMKAAAYVANFGGEHFHLGDVAKVKAGMLPGHADCCWMSPPCVGFSEAGDKQGFAELESGAFLPAWKLIEDVVAEGRAPRTIVFENVTGLLSSHGGQDIAMIRHGFEHCGYGHTTIEIDAKHFVPQSRPRIFIIGAHGVSNSVVADRAARALKALPERHSTLADGLDLDLDRRKCENEFPRD
jgi:DNA (cytosine-5)-methyltransferase 1